MKKQTIKELLDKRKDGSITPEELAVLESWYNHYAEHAEPFQNREAYLADMQLLEEAFPPAGQLKTVRLWPRVVAAAAAIMVLGAGVLFYNSKTALEDARPPVQLAHDVAPGVQGATLTLANGQTIRLSDAANGQIAQQAGVRVSKTADGQVVYQVKSSASEVTTSMMNTLKTEKGETYILTLPDKSKVWLNAASSLTYAANLNEPGKASLRKVKLVGEAYFEIAKDKAHPFVVESGGQLIRVLGTHFNVSAYAGEEVRTTLLEGSVDVSADARGRQVLKPGQQAVLSAQDLSVKEVNPDYAVAWMKGYFMFNNETLETAMLKIARWYNVEVVYDDHALKKETLFGTISRFGNISGILKMIERADVVRFTIEGNTVHVKRKKTG
jgi:transmembrane sensor